MRPHYPGARLTEKTFGEDEIIVSKTDLRGVITYVNDVFVRVSGYSQGRLLGAPHNIIRHPLMPRCVFRLLWQTIQERQEIFAYVLNLAKDGTGYWVFAHVTPSYSPEGEHVGFHSNRRAPFPDALAQIRPLYERLLEAESHHANPRQAAEAGSALLSQILEENGTDYSTFVFGLSRHSRLDAAEPVNTTLSLR
jgi:PAS domain S-box-containing protein